MRWRSTALPVAALVAVAGCGGGSSHTGSAAQEGAVTPAGKHVNLSTPGVPKGEQKVRLRVVTARGRKTIALVPIYINGRGPFPFALDTGASQSLIDAGLVRDLGLRTLGPSVPLHGVTGGGRGQMVQVKRWRAGRVGLHPDTIASLRLFAGTRGGPVGLLGSDVLSRFGKIAVDYDKDVLLLDPPVK